METGVYRALRSRIQLFTAVVGRLQPILSGLPAQIARVAPAAPAERQQARADLVAQLQQEVGATPEEAFDIDDAIEACLEMPPRPPVPYGMEELGHLLDQPRLLPPGMKARRVSSKDVFWSPGSPAFPQLKEGREAPEGIIPIRYLLQTPRTVATRLPHPGSSVNSFADCGSGGLTDAFPVEPASVAPPAFQSCVIIAPWRVSPHGYVANLVRSGRKQPQRRMPVPGVRLATPNSVKQHR